MSIFAPDMSLEEAGLALMGPAPSPGLHHWALPVLSFVQSALEGALIPLEQQVSIGREAMRFPGPLTPYDVEGVLTESRMRQLI